MDLFKKLMGLPFASKFEVLPFTSQALGDSRVYYSGHRAVAIETPQRVSINAPDGEALEFASNCVDLGWWMGAKKKGKK